MAPLFITALVIGYHPFDPTVVETRCDLIEINHVYRVSQFAATHVLDQVIFWAWQPETLDDDQDGPASAYRVLAYRLLDKPGHVPVRHRGRWRCSWTENGAVVAVVVVTSEKTTETWTSYDPEVLDRKTWPLRQRRDLAAPPAALR